MADRDLVELFGRLEQAVEPDPRFVDDVLRRVESVLTAAAVDSSDVKELDMAQFVETRQRRRWMLPVIGVAAAVLVVIALLSTRSSDDKSQVNIAPPTTLDAVGQYAAQMHDTYGPFYNKLNLYFSTCQLSIVDIDFKACGQAIDDAIAAINTFEVSVAKLQPPAALVDDQATILSADPPILDILQRSRAAVDAQDVQALQAINPTFQAAYNLSCGALVHYNSLTTGDDHLRTDLGPGCSDM